MSALCYWNAEFEGARASIFWQQGGEKVLFARLSVDGRKVWDSVAPNDARGPRTLRRRMIEAARRRGFVLQCERWTEWGEKLRARTDVQTLGLTGSENSSANA